MAADKMMKDEGKKKEKAEDNRGALDDWEALKIILDAHPSLKQRVLHKLRGMRDGIAQRSTQEGLQVSQKDAKNYRMERNRKDKMEKDKK